VRRLFTAIQAGDADTLYELLTPDAVTRWPQSGERITGATSCVNIYTNYPGGPPAFRLQRVTGEGDTWVAELVGDYPNGERWHMVSLIGFDGDRVARMTDFFGPTFPAPEWRSEWVQVEPQSPPANG
jgi:hypothetical protein